MITVELTGLQKELAIEALQHVYQTSDNLYFSDEDKDVMLEIIELLALEEDELQF